MGLDLLHRLDAFVALGGPIQSLLHRGLLFCVVQAKLAAAPNAADMVKLLPTAITWA
jgi:hypothetical protein